MFDLGMRTSDLEQESRSTHASNFGLFAFGLCCGFPPVASPGLWDHGTDKGLTRQRRSSRRNDPLMRFQLAKVRCTIPLFNTVNNLPPFARAIASTA